MDYVTLGRTGITVNKNGFGALPIQRLGVDDTVFLLKKAYENNITFFDTARDYTDSEQKIGIALSGVRDKIVIATKTMAEDGDTLRKNLQTSLDMLQTDYIDIYQSHNRGFCPKPGDNSGIYDAMLEAKAQGKIRHIGLTNHRLHIAHEALESGLYDTIQYPVSYLTVPDELEFIRQCIEQNIGILAMKALSGGLITNSAAAYAFLAQFPNVIPIWGIQRESELDEFIAYQTSPPILDDELKRVIALDAKELGGEFCRGCGYCMPCPVEIDIHNAARMNHLIRRAPRSMWGNPAWQENMKLIDNCTNCRHCANHCPYGLDVPKLLRDCWADYKNFIIE